MVNLFKSKITWILIFAFLIRMAISLWPAFEIDQNAFRIWSIRLATGGFANFYSKNILTDYTPGFLYFLWLAGLIKQSLLLTLPLNSIVYDLLLKLPANIADVLTGLIIYHLIKKVGQQKAIVASLLYIFNPAIFFNSSIWGQFDGIATLSIIVATILLLKKRFLRIGISLAAIALTLKPQLIFVLPPLGILFLQSTKRKEWFIGLFTFLTTMIVVYLPFISNNPLTFVKINLALGNTYKCTTCFAFNFWGMFGNWKDDSALFLSYPLIYWGILLSLIISIVILIINPMKLKYKEPFIYLTIALSIMTLFTFLTRMHERYLFPFFSFFLIAAFLFKSRKLLFFYILFSSLSVINQYLPYSYYNFVYPNKPAAFHPPFTDFLMNNFNLLSAIFFLSFLLLLIYFLKISKTLK